MLASAIGVPYGIIVGAGGGAEDKPLTPIHKYRINMKTLSAEVIPLPDKENHGEVSSTERQNEPPMRHIYLEPGKTSNTRTIVF